MKNRYYLVTFKLLPFLFLYLLCGVNVMAQGTIPVDTDSDGKLEIADKSNLLYLSQNPSADWSADYEQTADIIFTTADFESGGDFYNGGAGFSPIGNSTTSFTGSYDGQDHTISNLYINRPSESYIGLFGYSRNASGVAEIKNIGVKNVDIAGDNSVGGLAGINSSTISNSYSTGSVSGDLRVGGLVGYNYSLTTTNSYSTCSVSGRHNVGGLVGWNESSTVSNSYSTGSVSGSGRVGGLVGLNYESVNTSFWDTQTSGTTTGIGGGTTTGATGKTTAEMKDVVTFTSTSTAGLSSAWDFVTNPNDDSGNDDYWDMDQLGTVNNGYPILSWQDGADDVLELNYSGGSGTEADPYQISTTAELIELSNTSGDWGAHFIQTADIAFNADETQVDWDGNGTADGSGTSGFSPIGNVTTNFTGSYNGQHYTVSNLYINRPSEDYIGLFGIIDGAAIQNVGLPDVNIIGNLYVGGLVGVNSSSTVNNSYATGNVSGTGNYVGGLVGVNQLSSTVSNSYATGSVSGSNELGGLVGFNSFSSIVSNSYASGSVSGSAKIGGLVGENYTNSTVSNSYAIGSVSGSAPIGGLVGNNNSSNVSDSFWDTETSGQSSSAGGTGKTTAEMKAFATFTNTSTEGLNSAWDFVTNPNDDSSNDDYWEINSGFNNGYPILSWQSVEVTGITTTPEIISNSNIGFTAQSGSISLNFVEMNSTPSNFPGGAVTINKYWEISDITGGSIKLRLYYLTSLASSFSGSPKIIHYNGSNWEVLPTEVPVIVGSLTYVETTNYYSSFSPVSVGDDASPLPVELVSFTGELVDNTVQLNWRTATEVNNYGFEILRSAQNDSTWDNIGFVQGHGTTNSPKNYEFTDSELSDAESVDYRLKQIDNDGTFVYSKTITVDLTTITGIEEEIPIVYSLSQNYPNPFNPSTKIQYSILEQSEVTIKVYDLIGREVSTLVNKEMKPGFYEAEWHAGNFSSGVYFYRITTTTGFTAVKKLMLIK